MRSSPFLLFMSPQKAFPQMLKASSGEAFNINADFKTALKIIDLSQDDELLDNIKYETMLTLFYKDKLPPIQEAIELMYEFIMGAEKIDNGYVGKSQPPVMDYSFDAEAIYVSILKEYRIDIITAPFIHWYKFLMMISGLSDECPLGQRRHIRSLSTKDYKGESLTKIRDAKAAVRIPTKIKEEDRIKDNKLIEMWG